MEKSREVTRNKSVRQQQQQQQHQDQQQVNSCTDRNANSGTTREFTEDLLEGVNNENASCFDNYMKLNYYDPTILVVGAEGTSAQFTELFCDFPVSYETTEVITATQFAKHNLITKPPPAPSYNEPAPPTPPPISQLPKRLQDTRLQQLSHNANVSLSAPATPSRGKVVLSKKERKELNKLHKLLDRTETTSNTSINLGHLEAAAGEILSGSHSENNTYRGRVLELKNCIAKINSKVLFGSLNRNAQKSLPPQEELLPANETSLSQTAPSTMATDTRPPNLNHNDANHNDASYSEKLKNLPVRQRKVHTSHMENYCLFDPVDFINDKALRKRTNLTHSAVQQVQQGLRDPLFSSRQSLEFPDEELVPEIIYDNKEISDVEEQKNFDHHNYFVIDPEDFEKEGAAFNDVDGMPNKHTNEHISNEKFELISNQDIQQQEKEAESLEMSKSFEHLLTQAHEGPVIVKSVSQESKDINGATALSGLVESSSSTASALTCSSTSATSTHQTTLQRTKKKLTFLTLSPFRSSQSTRTSCHNNENDSRSRKEQNDIAEHKSIVERAMSELVSSDHMLHLQQMLLNSKENMRSRTVPIESNYVLFNPGPVPSRNVPYKVRKPRPLSTNSDDADSGFLSPCSPDEMSSLKSNPAILVLQQCDSVQGYLEVRYLFPKLRADNIL